MKPMDQVNLIGMLADLKEQHYRQTLALSALLDLLVDKDVLTRDEVEAKMAELDALSLPPAYPNS